MKSINRFLIERGVTNNDKEITILQMVQWVDDWHEEITKGQLPNNDEIIKQAKINSRFGDVKQFSYEKMGAVFFMEGAKWMREIAKKDLKASKLIDKS